MLQWEKYGGGKLGGAIGGLNNLAETSSIMKRSPEGCVSPPAVPVLLHKKTDADTVEMAGEQCRGGGSTGGGEGPRLMWGRSSYSWSD